MSTVVQSAGVVLSDEQQRAADAAIAAIEARVPLFRIGGYAGTGKTTILKYILAALRGHTEACAFTGKAASVMRRKGVHDAKTIHGTIYDYKEDTREFVRRPFLAGSQIAVDEGSMVSTSLWLDLQSYGLPILVVGDPGQLEPVGDDPRLMRDCDVVLETIHRQALNSTIVEFANKVRLGGSFRHGDKGQVSIRPKSRALESLDWADQYLCGFNKTRVDVNIRKREKLGRSGFICEGERLICLQNCRELAVFNGQMFTVTKVRYHRGDIITCDLVDDDGRERAFMPIWPGCLNRVEKLDDGLSRKLRHDRMIVDYGYCTTVHKFQGSEADKVAVIDEQCSVWDPVRWRYTAITRAADELRYYYN